MSMNFYDGPFPAGVPNPYTVMLHSYPTRFHGAIYARPMYSLPFLDAPNDFVVEEGMEGLGASATAPAAPRPGEDCDTTYPLPAAVVDAATFAAYAQNQACHEHVEASKSTRRWLVGLGAAFVVGVLLGRTK